MTADIPKRYFEITQSNTIHTKQWPVYKDGIIYTNYYPKGEVLSAFLKQMNLKPNKLIFIDDRLSNIHDIENMCKVANISFTGVHDDRIMNKYNAFNKDLGQYQFYHLEHHHVWLSDLEAQKIYHDNCNSF